MCNLVDQNIWTRWAELDGPAGPQVFPPGAGAQTAAVQLFTVIMGDGAKADQ